MTYKYFCVSHKRERTRGIQQYFHPNAMQQKNKKNMQTFYGRRGTHVRVCVFRILFPNWNV